MIIVSDNINPTLSQQTEKNCEKGISTDFKKMEVVNDFF